MTNETQRKQVEGECNKDIWDFLSNKEEQYKTQNITARRIIENISKLRAMSDQEVRNANSLVPFSEYAAYIK